MAKDDKGHGNASKGWGHEQHFAEAQRLYKAAATHPDKKAATDMRAKGHEHAAEAKHMMISEKRRANGATPAQKMGVARTNKDGSTFSIGAKLPRWGAHSTHGPEAATGMSKVRSTTQNRKY
jgi:hypothetical protein